MNIKHIAKDAAGCLLSLTLCGCGTVIHGGRQKITIQSEPSGAMVRTETSSERTPGALELSRRTDHTLIISKEGFQPCEVEINRRTSPWLWGNILLLPFAVVGVITDYYTGGYYELEPSQVTVQLQRNAASVPNLSFQKP